MKTGRNDACPCGSGKKYKKCCLAKEKEKAARMEAAAPLPVAARSSRPATPIAPVRAMAPPPPPREKTPLEEKAHAFWKEFKSEQSEGREALFLKVLEDDELLVDELVFEMLSRLRQDAIASGERQRFVKHVETLRERGPEVFEESDHYYLSWLVQDALVDDRHEAVPALARQLAAQAADRIDTVNRAKDALLYHGQLSVLIELHRMGWPDVKVSEKIIYQGIRRFADDGVNCEIFDFLQRTAVPDPADPVLLDRIKFYFDEPRMDYLAEFIGDLTGKAVSDWTVADFALRPPRQSPRDDWDDDNGDKPEKGETNLLRLIAQFLGYAGREEGISFPRLQMVRQELYSYFLRRNAGELDPQPSMLERAMNPKLKLPKPPRPVHPLCPERVTFEARLAELMGFMSPRYHTATALFMVIPAWLRFLELQRLIDVETRRKVVQELLPLHAALLKPLEGYLDDPTLFGEVQTWPANAAKDLPKTAND